MAGPDRARQPGMGGAGSAWCLQEDAVLKISDWGPFSGWLEGTAVAASMEDV
jgi:hypothetical protein